MKSRKSAKFFIADIGNGLSDYKIQYIVNTSNEVLGWEGVWPDLDLDLYIYIYKVVISVCLSVCLSDHNS